MGGIIREIFSSVQGEGPFVGCRQVFIRFLGCNLSCRYCDTRAGEDQEKCRVETVPGKKVFSALDNPISVSRVLETIKCCFPPGLHHSVSLTGGEPLLQGDFLGDLLPGLKELGLRIYLETNGSLPEKLEPIIRLVDFISMDLKLPGIAGCPPLWDRHLHFLSVAKQAGVFVKIVMDDSVCASEYERSLDLVAGVDAGIALVIQPLTVGGRCALSPQRALELQAVGLKKLRDVRIIPQAHVFMQQL